MYLLKEAAYTSQDKAKSVRKRNSYPERPDMPRVVMDNDVPQEKKVKTATDDSDKLVVRGKNKPAVGQKYPFENQLHYWNTISGTGYGRPYAAQKDNPWRA